MEWRKGKIYEDGKKGRKILLKIEWREGRLFGRWNEGTEDYIEDEMKGKII